MQGFTSTMRFAMLRMRWRSCVMSRMVPSKRLSACSSTSALAMSRWLVGSSRHSSGLGATSIFASAKRPFSPPESTLTFFSTASPSNRKAPSRLRTWLMFQPGATWSSSSNTVLPACSSSS